MHWRITTTMIKNVSTYRAEINRKYAAHPFVRVWFVVSYALTIKVFYNLTRVSEGRNFFWHFELIWSCPHARGSCRGSHEGFSNCHPMPHWTWIGCVFWNRLYRCCYRDEGMVWFSLWSYNVHNILIWMRCYIKVQNVSLVVRIIKNSNPSFHQLGRTMRDC